jgi:hypothetical protein
MHAILTQTAAKMKRGLFKISIVKVGTRLIAKNDGKKYFYLRALYSHVSSVSSELPRGLCYSCCD